MIRKKLWKEYFWSRSFCLLTTGGAPIEIIKKYIESIIFENKTLFQIIYEEIFVAPLL